MGTPHEEEVVTLSPKGGEHLLRAHGDAAQLNAAPRACPDHDVLTGPFPQAPKHCLFFVFVF